MKTMQTNMLTSLKNSIDFALQKEKTTNEKDRALVEAKEDGFYNELNHQERLNAAKEKTLEAEKRRFDDKEATLKNKEKQANKLEKQGDELDKQLRDLKVIQQNNASTLAQLTTKKQNLQESKKGACGCL